MGQRVLIVGGGRIGVAVARSLADAGHDVTVIERDGERAAALRELLPGHTVNHADGADPSALEAAGVHVADALVAAAGDDETNLVVTSLARGAFGVPRTVARIVDPGHAWMYTPELGVDAAVDQASLVAGLVAEEVSLGEVVTLAKLRRGRFALVEQQVPADSGAVGQRVATLALPRDCVLVAVVRGEQLVAVRGDVELQAGDLVLAVVHEGAAAALQEALGRS